MGSEKVLENFSWGPGKAWIFLSVKECEPWVMKDMDMDTNSARGWITEYPNNLTAARYSPCEREYQVGGFQKAVSGKYHKIHQLP